MVGAVVTVHLNVETVYDDKNRDYIGHLKSVWKGITMQKAKAQWLKVLWYLWWQNCLQCVYGTLADTIL